jgi:outer membrane receptor for ferrienterochelin and colicin
MKSVAFSQRIATRIGGGLPMKRTRIACGISFALCSAAALIAQEAARAQEQVIVTAQRREQNLQEAPISMVAITGESLDAGLLRLMLACCRASRVVYLDVGDFIAGSSFESTVGGKS